MIAKIAIPLVLGLSIFLTGMKVMELALHQWAGPYLSGLLERFTKTPLRGMLVSTVITAGLQSSSAVTVITIGLVNAGLLTFPQTLGIILGTNIGTCFTTELIGLNLTRWSFPLLIGSGFVWLASFLIPSPPAMRARRRMRWLHAIRCLSLATGGFASVMLGVEVMQSIAPHLQSRGLFAWLVEQSQRSLLWGVIAGAAVTAVIHSSAATIAIAMGLASVQAISVELGIAIVLGANVGTCVTALLASIGGSESGRFVAWTHILLNVGGALLFLPLLPWLHQASVWLASEPSSQIARAQTIFNVVCSFLALPFCYLPIFKTGKPAS